MKCPIKCNNRTGLIYIHGIPPDVRLQRNNIELNNHNSHLKKVVVNLYRLFYLFFCSFFYILFQTLTALGKSWHPEHFVCLVCEKPITAVTFNERDGNPVCSACFAKKYSETCNQCHKAIVGVSKLADDAGEDRTLSLSLFMSNNVVIVISSFVPCEILS